MAVHLNPSARLSFNPVSSKQEIRTSVPLDESTKTLSEILQSWGMINLSGELTFETTVKAKPLEGLSLRRWKDLLKKEIPLQIGKIKVSLTYEAFISGFNAYAKRALGQEVKSYLRGGYALYVVNMPEYFEALVEDFFHHIDKRTIDKKREEIQPFLDAMKKKWQEMPLPNDVDWLDLLEKDDPRLKNIPAAYLSELHSTFHPEMMREQGFSKFIMTRTTAMKMENAAPFLIWSPQTAVGAYPLDRTTGVFKHMSLASWCDMFVTMDGNPFTPSNELHQVILDWGMKVVRIQDWHSLNFPALAAFCQYAYQGFDLIPNAEALPLALSKVWEKIEKEHSSEVPEPKAKKGLTAYQEFLSDINGRLRGHKLEKISFLFSVAMQFYLGFSNNGTFSPTFEKIWKSLLITMSRAVKDKLESDIDFKLVEFFKLFEGDFSKLVSALVHLATACAFSPTENVLIAKINRGAVILRVGNTHLYLRKDLFKQNLSRSYPLELEQFLPLSALKLGQQDTHGFQEVAREYVEHTAEFYKSWNPYCLFTHLCTAHGEQSLPSHLKRYLKLLVDPKKEIDRTLLATWMSHWYPKFEGKKPRGIHALSAIASTSFEDARLTYNSLRGDFKQSLAADFAILASSHDVSYAIDLLEKTTGISQKDKTTALREIIKATSKDFQKVLTYLKTLTSEDVQRDLFPYTIRKLWENKYDTEASDILLDVTKRKLISADEIDNLVCEFAKRSNPAQRQLFLIAVSTHTTLSHEIKELLESENISSETFEQDETRVIHQHMARLLSENNYRESFDFLIKFIHIWNEETYSSHVLQIFKLGKADRPFIIEISKKLPRIKLSQELANECVGFYEELLRVNFFQALEFLFLPFTCTIFSAARHASLRTLAFKEAKNSDALLLLLKKLTYPNIEENIEIIINILTSCANSWSQKVQVELPKFLDEHLPSIVECLHSSKNFVGLTKLLDILNLFKVKSRHEVASYFLDALSENFVLDTFITCLRNGRFSHADERKQALVLQTLRSHSHQEEIFKELVHSLRDDTPLSDLKGFDPSRLEILLNRFSSREDFVSSIFSEHFELVKKIPEKSLKKLYEHLSSILQNPKILLPLIDYWVQKEESSTHLEGLISRFVSNPFFISTVLSKHFEKVVKIPQKKAWILLGQYYDAFKSLQGAHSWTHFCVQKMSDPQQLEALLKQFSSDEFFVSLVLTESLDVVKKIPQTSLIKFLESWCKSLKKTLHPVVEYLLEKQELPNSQLMNLIWNTEFWNIVMIEKFMLKKLHKVPLKIVIQELLAMEPYLDSTHSHYRHLWENIVKEIMKATPTKDEAYLLSSEVLHFSIHRKLLEKTGIDPKPLWEVTASFVEKIEKKEQLKGIDDLIESLSEKDYFASFTLIKKVIWRKCPELDPSIKSELTQGGIINGKLIEIPRFDNSGELELSQDPFDFRKFIDSLPPM